MSSALINKLMSTHSLLNMQAHVFASPGSFIISIILFHCMYEVLKILLAYPLRTGYTSVKVMDNI